MKPTLPVVILREAALEAIGNAAAKLRSDGWDAVVSVDVADESEDHFYDVTLRIRIGHSLPIPTEAR